MADALTFEPNGNRIDALQVDGEPAGSLHRVISIGDYWTAHVSGIAAAVGVGPRSACQQAIVRAWAKRFPHA
jgi:hypothetical protein